MTVHFPIVLLLISSSTGLLYLSRYPRPELHAITWWSMYGGWLGAFLAVITGLFDQAVLPPRPAYYSTLNWHVATGLLLLLVYGTLLYQNWIYRPKDIKDKIFLDEPSARNWTILLLILGFFLVILSSWHGGQLVYVWGVNVGG